MNLTRTTNTANTRALVVADKKKANGAKPAPGKPEAAPAKPSAPGDSILIESTPPVPGPGAGGGYDGDEIPADDDGPVEELNQEPVESDGPGAGGGYETEVSWAFGSAFSGAPLAIFASMGSSTLNVATGRYEPHWLQVLPQTFDPSGTGPLLMLEAPKPLGAPEAPKEKKATPFAQEAEKKA